MFRNTPIDCPAERISGGYLKVEHSILRPPLASLSLHGTFIALSWHFVIRGYRHRYLQANWILIHGGALEIGSADLPSAHLAQTTLTDTDTLADTEGKGLANRRLWPIDRADNGLDRN
jgi:hypothetical protein